MDVGEMEAHRAALGDLLRLVEIGAGGGGVALRGAEPRAREQSAREMISILSKSVDRRFDVRMRAVEHRNAENRAEERDAAEGEIVHRYSENPLVAHRERQRGRSAMFDVRERTSIDGLTVRAKDPAPDRALGSGQQEVAESESWQ